MTHIGQSCKGLECANVDLCTPLLDNLAVPMPLHWHFAGGSGGRILVLVENFFIGNIFLLVMFHWKIFYWKKIGN